ncbi:glycosyltransferase family 4 protein [Roseomonas xinghualingensis]|uniref:glycosyltransferase family 4 protein n=1 Tax=Roseomonas xinghualingensis TaxID=2986475 RepID=UPI0021F21D51|nr:glycosyltransferase family 4 protein [Roseomonas sp. SXEYE001]MCV4210060.1 glycosyltransferase family 4 protein [Roseomonas sp. SXEYE001]
MKILYSHRIQSRDGQGLHLEQMVAALRDMKHEVLVVGPPSYGRGGLGGDSGSVALARRLLPNWATELAELAYNLPAYLRLLRAARAFKPDAIYERANLFFIAGAILAWQLRVPYLLEVNSPLADERSRFGNLQLRRLGHATERFIWRRADCVLPVTEVLAHRIRAEGVPQERIEVIPNGIDLTDFPPSGDAQSIEKEDITLGFVGFVRSWHGLDRVLRALAAWQGKPRLHLRLVGDGPALVELQDLAAELGMSDRVRFTGLVEPGSVPIHIKEFDIALQPAAVSYASPLKIFEYMAAGRAIIAPDQPNIREILENGRTALLFDPAVPGTLWAAVIQLAQDPDLRARLGRAARQEVLQRDLTWPANARRVSALTEVAMAHKISAIRKQKTLDGLLRIGSRR